LGADLRKQRGLDVSCVTGGGDFRVGYPTAGLNRTLDPSLRTKVRGRAILTLTSSSRFSLRGIKPGTREKAAKQALGRAQRVSVGTNVWYVARRGGIVQLVKTRRGVVDEIGIGDARLTGSVAKTKRFLLIWPIQ